jgi:hypothetical protein
MIIRPQFKYMRAFAEARTDLDTRHKLRSRRPPGREQPQTYRLRRGSRQPTFLTLAADRHRPLLCEQLQNKCSFSASRCLSKGSIPTRSSQSGAIEYVNDATCDEGFNSMDQSGDTTHKISCASTHDLLDLSACVNCSCPFGTRT